MELKSFCGTLKDGYSFREINREMYDQFRRLHEPTIFPNRFDMYVSLAYSQAEKDSLETLGRRLGDPYELRLGLFHQEQMVGWSYGVQVSADTFRMATTGILPAHQGKGIYSAYLRELAEHIKEVGFQCLYSRHYATDNGVILPKLRFGFLITGFELSDEYGLLLRLHYFFNETRRKVLHARSGFQQPDDSVKALIRQYDKD
ncbi:MAG: hypothetical protein K2Z81_05690 [Cyanobacteria bacterium]|nr:hypothetical protein [Cyanobacteriota bacterium]